MSKAFLTVLAVPNPEGMKEMKEYLEKVGPLLMSGGGKIIQKNKVTKVVYGDGNVKMILVMEYESADLIDNIFNSDDYKKLIPLRERGFLKIDILITEMM